MKLKSRDGREVEASIQGEQDDLQLVDVTYVDDGSEVSEDVILQLESDYASEICDEWYQDRVCEAEARADAMEDR